MKLHDKYEDDDVAIDMSPMIDMVFLLLIFFLVASTVIDQKVPITVPTAAFAKVPENTTGRLVVTVNKDEELFIGQLPVTLEKLKEILEPELEADENLRILIRSDADVKYKMNEKIMTACAEVGANDLIYTAFEE